MDQPIAKYKSKTDSRGRIIYFLSGMAYITMALSVFYLIYKMISADKAKAKGEVAATGEVAPAQAGGGKCQLPTILYMGVVIVAIGLVWTTLRIRNGQ